MESWKRKLRMGMVGGGQGAFIGAVHRIASALDQQIELAAGCFSRDPKNTKTTGKQLYMPLARCYKTYEQMAKAESKLPASQRIDFVSIVTPNASHFAIAKRFLEAGVHVICDKPMTCTLEEAEDLVKLVEKTKLVFALTHNYTGHPLIRHARQMFQSGQMGTVRKVIVEYLQDFLMYPHEKHGQKQAVWRVDPTQAGMGGTLGDVGSHCLNLLEYVTGYHSIFNGRVSVQSWRFRGSWVSWLCRSMYRLWKPNMNINAIQTTRLIRVSTSVMAQAMIAVTGR